MLQHLHVKNIALIDEVEIDFDDQLNILTGETGAGKSILIGSINIALGKRSSKDILREGAEKGQVELLFKVDEAMAQKIKSFGVECEDEVLISRVISTSGRSVSRVNGVVVTNQIVKQLAALLIDIHGQHEHQSLLDEQCHIQLLDMFCKEDLTPMTLELKSLLDAYSELKAQKKKLSLNEDEKNRKLSILEYEVNEISDANLTSGEEEELLTKRKKHINAKKIYDSCCESYGLIQGDYQSEADVLSYLNRCISLLESIKEYDTQLESNLESLQNAAIWIQEASVDLRSYIDGIDHDGAILEEIENRLDLINRLKRKYGDSIQSILDYLVQAQDEYDQMLNVEERLHRIDSEMKQYEGQIDLLCEKMSAIRKNTAEMLQVEVERMLTTLQFEYAKFKVDFKRAANYGYQGYDDIRFLITTNIGEPLRPLHDVASGGEMSRIMLAIKTILAKIDEIPTLIFDEVDTGISGRTAQKVAEKLSMIGQYHQVLCITHLPQIAAMADQHLLIEKFSDKSKTTTEVHPLSHDQRNDELARLLGGARITDITLRNAKELRILAEKFKETLK